MSRCEISEVMCENLMIAVIHFFFFQAEDGIRDKLVTGVQTCALPIWFIRKEMATEAQTQSVLLVDDSPFFRNMLAPVLKSAGYKVRTAASAIEGLATLRRSEERRVGKERRTRSSTETSMRTAPSSKRP